MKHIFYICVAAGCAYGSLLFRYAKIQPSGDCIGCEVEDCEGMISFELPAKKI